MKNKLKPFLVPIYYFIWKTYIGLMNSISREVPKSYLEIPIIINNRNRLTFLKQLIAFLEKSGYKNIHILDNNSNYQPLLEYYKICSHNIIRLKENVGHLALWDSKEYKKFIKGYYVYTDADVVPIDDCPADFLNTFLLKMENDKSIMKIGLGLKIDDLPDCFEMKEQVIEWEKPHREIDFDENYYLSNVDTTFALYRPYVTQGASRLKMLRSKSPLEAYHMPWYNDTKNLNNEELFYIKNAKTSTHWTSKK